MVKRKIAPKKAAPQQSTEAARERFLKRFQFKTRLDNSKDETELTTSDPSRADLAEAFKDRSVEEYWKEFDDPVIQHDLEQFSASIRHRFRSKLKAETDHGEKVSRPLSRGKLCEEVVCEMRKIKNLYNRGRRMAEIEADFPNFQAWKVRNMLGAEYQGIFERPGTWGPPVRCAYRFLSIIEGVSMDTVKNSRKAYKKTQEKQ